MAATHKDVFEQMQRYIPGGVNSPVRAFGAVGGTPVVMERGDGAYLFDIEGQRYVDLLGSWGPLILGHNHPQVLHAVEQAVASGVSFGTPCMDELELARLIVDAVPGIEKVRMVNSGTEAGMTAVRLARAATGRDRVVKVDGGYHGHADTFLVSAGSGAATFGLPNSPGVTSGTVRDTLVVPFGDAEALDEVLAANKDQVACFILEPVPGNMGMVVPEETYLHQAREITRRYGVLLIFDEVISGFRVDYGGAQKHFGVTPDLTILGKIIGGGMPVGACGGRGEIMDLLAPAGPVYQAGTLSGNPLAMAAGRATLTLLQEKGTYRALAETGKRLFSSLAELASQHGVPATVNYLGSMGTLFFTDGPVRRYEDAARADKAAYARYFHGMLDRGVYVAPGQFECTFVSAAHGEKEIDFTLEAAEDVFRRMSQGGVN